MSLDKFVKPDKKQDIAKEPEKPAAKPAAVKEKKPGKTVKKAPVNKKVKTAPAEEDLDDVARSSQIDAIAEEGGVESNTKGLAVPRESALKAMGMVKYALTCPACKYKKELLVAGDPKPHQSLCKKCGAQMKVSKKA